jgi:hypothetical protein
MSFDEITEHAKKVATEEVARRVEISEKTRLRMSLFTAIAVCLTIIGATWAASWGIQNYLHQIQDGQADIVKAMEYRVPEQQFTSWAYALQNANRPIPAVGLIVPDPAQFKPATSPNK